MHPRPFRLGYPGQNVQNSPPAPTTSAGSTPGTAGAPTPSGSADETLPNSSTDGPGDYSLPVQVAPPTPTSPPLRVPTPAQVRSRDTNWSRLQMSGAFGNLLTARRRGNLAEEDIADLDAAIDALRRIEVRRVERQRAGPERELRLQDLLRIEARRRSS